LKAQLLSFDGFLHTPFQQEPEKITLYQPVENNLLSNSIAALNLTNKTDPKKDVYHFFFEYGPINKTAKGSIVNKSNSFFAAGMKIHRWYETNLV